MSLTILRSSPPNCPRPRYAPAIAWVSGGRRRPPTLPITSPSSPSAAAPPSASISPTARPGPICLGQQLDRDFPKLWINNAGLDGATTYRHLILMEDYVVHLKPKVVLFLVGINDVGVGYLDYRPRPGFGGWIRSLTNRSEVYSLGLNLYRYFIVQRRGLLHREVDLKKEGTLEVPEEIQAGDAAEITGGGSCPITGTGWSSSSGFAGIMASSRSSSPSLPSTARGSTRPPGWTWGRSGWGRTSTAP